MADNPAVSSLKGSESVINNRVYITSAGVIIGKYYDTCKRHLVIQDDQFELLLENYQTRNIDRISKIALAAAAVTMDNWTEKIKKDQSNNYGITLGTQFSALESIHSFDMRALEKGALTVNPGLFPNTVINSPACQVSIQYSFAGPVYTVCNGIFSSLDAIGLAYNFVKTGIVPLTLAGGVDEIAQLQAMIHDGKKPLGEAGGFIMMESEKNVSNKKKLAEVAAYESKTFCKAHREILEETTLSLIKNAVTAGGDELNNITNISLNSSLSINESSSLLFHLCEKINNNILQECLEINWMGAGGIVQTDEALKNIARDPAGKKLHVLLNIDKTKASVIVLKSI